MSEGNRRTESDTAEHVASDSALFPLAHPALTSMPVELLSQQNRGELPRGGVALSVVRPEAAAWAARAVRNGRGAEMLERLRLARRAVERGATLREVVCDGTLPGWHLRLALSEIAGEAVANWDSRRGRTAVERQAVVRRAIDELMDARAHVGGWTVSGGAE